MLIYAIIAMMLAVTLYTTAVFMEKKAGILNLKQLIIFSFGLVFDTVGTTLMGEMSEGFTFDIHGITGAVALGLMLIHVAWAWFVHLKGSEKQKRSFHKFSFYVWLIWLFSFMTGMILNMG